MKKLIILLIALLCSVNGFAQEQKVRFPSAKTMTVKEIISLVEQQTGMSVAYNEKGFDLDRSISVEAGTRTLSDAFTQILDGTGMTIKVQGQIVAIIREGLEHTYTGVVRDELAPIPGAVVMLKDNPSVAQITSLDGKFSIKAREGSILKVSIMGYRDAEILLGPQMNNLDVVLLSDVELLEEVVVVGYGTTKKENLTGAVSVVSSESIGNRSRSSLGHILQGTVPGMTVTTSSGRPGESVSLNIRGWNSIAGGSPLVLVDGVIGSLDRVNPNDVESVSVLKDASSAAVYGAQAAFGVILVTTKQGSDNDGRAKISYSGRFGFTSPTSSTDWETRGYESVQISNIFAESYTGQQQVPYDTQDMYELWIRRDDKVENPERPWLVVDESQGYKSYKFYGNTDWWRYFYNDIKPTQSHDISFRGGTKNVKYFLSGNYSREQGVFRQNPDIHNKYNLRARFSFDATKWLNISNNTAFYTSIYTYPGASDLNSTFYNLTAGNFSHLVPMTPDGNHVRITDYGTVNFYSGILADKNYKNRNKTSNLTNTVEVTIKPIKQLEIKGNYSYSYNTYASMNRSINITYAGKEIGTTETLTTDACQDKLSEQMQTTDQHSVNVFATYSDTFKDAHNLKVMLGGNYETYYHKKLYATGYDLLSQELNDQNLISQNQEGVKRMETAGGQSQYALMGFFGRINYDYKGKYLVEVSGRYDGSSRFPKGQRWGLFPSFSLGWRLSQESFFSPVKKWWSDAKLRFSYGSLGNQQVGYYDYIRTVALGTQGYLFGGEKSSVATYGNPVASNLTWETVSQANLGLDLAFFNNRLTFSGEAYIRNTKNMLTTGKALPSSYGASAPKTNNADLRTKGYELMLSYRDQFMLLGMPFQYNVTATFNDYVGEITKFDNPTGDLSTYYEGMRYGEIWGYITDGFFATDAEAKSYDVDQSPVCSHNYSSAGNEKGLLAGDLKYVDLDGDHIIGRGSNTVKNPGDRKIIGNSQPRYQYGATVGFNWAGVDVSVFIQGIGRRDWYPGNDARYFWGLYARPFASWIQKDFLERCWSEENPDAYFPRPRAYAAYNTNDMLGTVNDRYLQNLGYCRLKNVTVGYTFPKKWMDKIKMDSIRIYFSGENLAYIAPGLHCDYMDPEMAMVGGKCHIYPWQKTFMFGIDINF